jgi:hypothetical protein
MDHHRRDRIEITDAAGRVYATYQGGRQATLKPGECPLHD